MSQFVVGIDLGTTFTGVAVARESGSGAMVMLGRRQHVMPTVVWLGPGADLAVGESAVRLQATDPSNVVSLFNATSDRTSHGEWGDAMWSSRS